MMVNHGVFWTGGLALLTALLSGCAFSYESSGRRHLIGWAWIEYAVEEEPPTAVADGITFNRTILPPATPAVRQQTLGVYLDVTADTPGLGLGYRDVLVVIPAQDAVTEFYFDDSDPIASRKKVFIRQHASGMERR